MVPGSNSRRGCGGSAHPHFLIWLSETEHMCRALRDLAPECRRSSLITVTIDALRAAHSDAVEKGVGKTAYRFRAPRSAERLMSAAAIKVRSEGRQPFGVFLLVGDDDPDPPPRCA